MPSLLTCLGWFFLITAPISFFEGLLSGSILNVLIAPLSAIGGVIIGLVILAFANSMPGTEATTIYTYWCIAAGVLTLGARVMGIVFSKQI